MPKIVRPKKIGAHTLRKRPAPSTTLRSRALRNVRALHRATIYFQALPGIERRRLNAHLIRFLSGTLDLDTQALRAYVWAQRLETQAEAGPETIVQLAKRRLKLVRSVSPRT